MPSPRGAAPTAAGRRSCRLLGGTGARKSSDEASGARTGITRRSCAGKALSYLTGSGSSIGLGTVVHRSVLTVCSEPAAASEEREGGASLVGRVAFAQLRAFDGSRPQLWLVGQPGNSPECRRGGGALNRSSALDRSSDRNSALDGESSGLGELPNAGSLSARLRTETDATFDEAAAVCTAQMRLEVSLATVSPTDSRQLTVIYLRDAIAAGSDGVTAAAAAAAVDKEKSDKGDKGDKADGKDKVQAEVSVQQRLLDFGSRLCVLEASSAEEAAAWVRVINDELWKSDAHFKELERTRRVSAELSEITALASRKLTALPGHPWQATQMCSVDERAADRLLREVSHDQLVASNKERLCRVYPKATRVLSDNVDPELFAMLSAAGFQMIALNLQTTDEATAYATALFGQNGRCGYLLAPPRSERGLALRLTLVSAVHVPRAGEGRIAEPPPRWYGLVPRLDTTPQPPSAASDSADIYVTVQVIGPGFCCAVHTLGRDGAVVEASSSNKVSPREVAAQAAAAKAMTAAAAASAAMRSEVNPSPSNVPHKSPVDAETLKLLQRHVWRSSTVLGNGFNAQWGTKPPAERRGEGDAGTTARSEFSVRDVRGTLGEDAFVLASQPELTVLRVCVWSASSVRLGVAGGRTPKEWLAPSTLPAVKDAGQASDTLLAVANVPLLSLRGGLRAIQLSHPRGGEPIELCSIIARIALDDETEVPFDALDGHSAPGANSTIGRPKGRVRPSYPANLVRRFMRRASNTSMAAAVPLPSYPEGANPEDDEVPQRPLQSSVI